MTSSFPDELKILKVVAVHKAGDKEDKKTANKDHNTANTGKKVLGNSNISNG